MKTTFNDAVAAIAAFNRDDEKTAVASDMFFALAADFICSRDGLRVSGVIAAGHRLLMVFEMADPARGRHRFLAVWEDGRGRLLAAAEVPRPLAGWLDFTPEAHTAFPEGMAQFGEHELGEITPVRLA